MQNKIRREKEIKFAYNNINLEARKYKKKKYKINRRKKSIHSKTR